MLFTTVKISPFLSASIFAALSLLWYLQRPGWKRLALHAVLSAVLIGIRFAGIYMLGLTAGMLLVEVVTRRLALRRALRDGFIYLFLASGFSLLFYPVLWHDPLGGVGEALKAMTGYPQYLPVFFMGQFISPQELPWTYLPVWIGITTPPVYLALMAVGLGRSFWDHPFAAASRGRLLALAWVLGGLAGVAVLRPVLYDGWRQMYFLCPGLLLLALEGAAWLAALFSRMDVRVRAGLLALATAALLGPVFYQMAKLHPYENVYFNRLAGRDMQEVKQRFDLDYWGLSYREGLEYILSTDARSKINVYGETVVGVRSAAILGSDELRLHFVDDLAQADYFLGNYRWHPGDYSYAGEVYAVRVGNAKILSVFKLSPAQSLGVNAIPSGKRADDSALP